MAGATRADESWASVDVHWLDGAAPPLQCGVSWGVPWPQGAVRSDGRFRLLSAAGVSVPLQSWPLAFWPDGSLKWSGMATVAPAELGPTLRLRADDGARPAPAGGVVVSRGAAALTVDTGPVQCTVPLEGPCLIAALAIDRQVVARDVELVCVRQEGHDAESGDRGPRVRQRSRIGQVVVEQDGPVRAVVRVEGVHQAEGSVTGWLPFVVRLYLYAGCAQVRLVHTVIYDGDPQRDVIGGLGVSAVVPLRDQVHNRHVRFAGDAGGLWAEPVQPVFGSSLLSLPDREPLPDANWSRQPGDAYLQQLAGRRLPEREAFDERGRRLLANYPVWDAYRLIQASADSFSVEKRTQSASCWLAAGTGRRAAGLVYVGDTLGGLALGVKDFWQSFPKSLQIRGAATDAARVDAWLWAPQAAAMDLRHYDVKAHTLEATYEDVEPGFSTPEGISRTSELTLWPLAGVPERQTTVAQAQLSARPPLLVCSPAYLQATQTLGAFSPPDRSRPGRRWVEDRLEQILAYYQRQVEQRGWYGFWDFGDIMHDYDYGRHTWRYDIGGCAWLNTEAAPDLWLWLSFLRTGRADLFRFAEAMTRHTSEVDVHHLGRFAGFGSRHNVRHWGCGAKEVRISQAAFKRCYYFLTTDERAGDLMREVLPVDRRLLQIDPMRKVWGPRQMPPEYPVRLRLGPDWLALAGNWLCEWERTLDRRWRDHLLAGLGGVATAPSGFLSGVAYGYNPDTGALKPLSPDSFGLYILLVSMGGAEVLAELGRLLDDEVWQRLWADFCRYCCATREQIRARYGREGETAHGSWWYARMPAYLGAATGDADLCAQAAGQLLGPADAADPTLAEMFTTRRVVPPAVLDAVDEGVDSHTINAAIWSLNAIQVLALAGDHLPERHPLWDGQAAGAPAASMPDGQPAPAPGAK